MATNNIINNNLGVGTATSLNIGSSTTINGVIDDDTMATASATTVPTSESTKAYVDAAGGGGGMVLLSAQTASASSILEFKDFFSSSYDNYVFYFSNIIPATNNTTFVFQLGTGATPTYVTTNYAVCATDLYTAAGGTQTNAATHGWISSGNTGIFGVNNTSAFPGLSGTLTLSGTNASSQIARGNSICSYYDASAFMNNVISGTSLAAATYTAIKFYHGAGNITSGKIAMYGVPNT